MSKIIKKLKINGLFDDGDISWDLNEVNVLVGKNGSGKTTILNTILNLLTQKKTKECFRSKEAILEMEIGGELKYTSSKINIGGESLSNLISAIMKMEEEKKEKKEKKETSINIAAMADTLNKIKSLEKKKGEEVQSEVIFEHFGASAELKDVNVTVEYISTVNLNANAKNKIEKGNGEEVTALDWEIDSEIERMKDLLEKKPEESKSSFNNFLMEINNLYRESDKKINFYDEKELIVKWIKTDEKIKIKNLSSGERQLLYILLKSFNSSLTNPIILMDEPEISLHISWQEKLISAIRNINKDSQLIIVTHSPAIVMDGWIGSLKDIKDIKKYPEEKNKKTKKQRLAK